jgi:hypothetical protein
MIHVSKFEDFKKINSLFLREHDRIIKKYKIDFISLKGVKIPIMNLYKIVSTLFKNNSINLKVSDIILLTLSSIGLLSKENKDVVKSLLQACKDRKILRHFTIVKNTIKSIKNLLNIIFKKEGVIIQNIEQSLKYKYSVDVLSIANTFIKLDNIKIKDFCYWYIVDQRNKPSKDLIDYININYYI